MFNWSLVNPRDILIIAAATLAIMLLAKPLFTAIDNATD